MTEGDRRVLGLMVDDGCRDASTGCWGFETFKGGDRGQRVVQGNAANACFAGHEQVRSSGYVANKLRP